MSDAVDLIILIMFFVIVLAAVLGVRHADREFKRKMIEDGCAREKAYALSYLRHNEKRMIDASGEVH